MLSRWTLDKKLAGLPPKKKLSTLQMDSEDPPGLHMESVAEDKVLPPVRGPKNQHLAITPKGR